MKEKEITDKDTITMYRLVCILLTIALVWMIINASKKVSDVKNKAIEHNCAEYNSKTGVFQWIAIDTTKVRWEKVK